jgi:hypothetical protein
MVICAAHGSGAKCAVAAPAIHGLQAFVFVMCVTRIVIEVSIELPGSNQKAHESKRFMDLEI